MSFLGAIGRFHTHLHQATLFTTSTILSFNIWQNSTFFCSSLRPPSPLTANANDTYYFCPVEPGPVAFSAAIPLGDHQYELLTINTRLRIVDTSSPAIELGCVDIATTPLNAHRDTVSIYGGKAVIVFWFSVALVIGYWIVVGLGRISAAWGRGGSGSDRSLWSRLEGAGYILASAISGEKFSSTPALLRFSMFFMQSVSNVILINCSQALRPCAMSFSILNFVLSWAWLPSNGQFSHVGSRITLFNIFSYS